MIGRIQAAHALYGRLTGQHNNDFGPDSFNGSGQPRYYFGIGLIGGADNYHGRTRFEGSSGDGPDGGKTSIVDDLKAAGFKKIGSEVGPGLVLGGRPHICQKHLRP